MPFELIVSDLSFFAEICQVRCTVQVDLTLFYQQFLQIDLQSIGIKCKSQNMNRFESCRQHICMQRSEYYFLRDQIVFLFCNSAVVFFVRLCLCNFFTSFCSICLITVRHEHTFQCHRIDLDNVHLLQSNCIVLQHTLYIDLSHVTLEIKNIIPDRDGTFFIVKDLDDIRFHVINGHLHSVDTGIKIVSRFQHCGEMLYLHLCWDKRIKRLFLFCFFRLPSITITITITFHRHEYSLQCFTVYLIKRKILDRHLSIF